MEVDRIQPVNPMIKLLLTVCLVIPTVGCVLMSIGAWDFKSDSLDGAMTATAIVSGLVGVVLISVLDRQ